LPGCRANLLARWSGLRADDVVLAASLGWGTDMKPRIRFSHRLNTWACWLTEDDWKRRTVGFGWTWQQALSNWIEQVWEAKQTGAAAVSAANN